MEGVAAFQACAQAGTYGLGGVVGEEVIIQSAAIVAEFYGADSLRGRCGIEGVALLSCAASIIGRIGDLELDGAGAL